MKILKNFGMLAYFVVAQVVASLALIFIKITSNSTWLDRLVECCSDGIALNEEYIKLISELIYPALVIADLLVVIPLVIFAIRRKEHLATKMSAGQVGYLTTLALALNFVVSGVVSILPNTDEYDSLMQVATGGGFLVTLVTAGILAPIAEELVFRYWMIKCTGGKYAILISSLLFGLAHFNLVQSSYAFIIGLVLGSIYKKSGYNLATCTLVHLVINCSSVLCEFLAISTPVVIVVGSSALAFVILHFFTERR